MTLPKYTLWNYKVASMKYKYSSSNLYYILHMSSSQVDAVCLSIAVNQVCGTSAVHPNCVCVHVSVIYKCLFCLSSAEWWTFVSPYFIRNVFAVTFSACSPLCAVSGPAPDELHLPKSKRRHSCLCLCISSLSYLTQTEGHSSTFPLPLATGHNALYETWKSITPLKDLQTNPEVICGSLLDFSFVFFWSFSCMFYHSYLICLHLCWPVNKTHIT